MVGGYVGDDGDVRSEIVAVIELEAADFQDVVVEVLGCDLICVTLSDVAAESDIETCLLHQVVDQ